MTDAELQEIERRADHLRRYRRLARIGAWSCDGRALRSGGIAIATLPGRSGGDHHRAAFYGNYLLELTVGPKGADGGRIAPEEDNQALIDEVRRLRRELEAREFAGRCRPAAAV